MKKILFIILMFLSINVNAMEYSEFQENKIEETSEIEVDTQRRYLYYNNTIRYGGYYPFGENIQEYPLVDESDYKYSDFTIWGNAIPHDIANREVEMKTVYNYRDMKEVRYIFINYANGLGNQIIFSEIELYINGNKINYEAFCNVCSSGLTNKIKNGIVSGEIYESLHQTGLLKLDLMNYYPSSSIKVRAIIYDPSYGIKTYRVTFTRNDDIKDSYFIKDASINYRSSNPNDKYIDEISYDNMILSKPQYYETVYSEEYVDSSIEREVTPVDLYRYRDKLFNYYCKEKVYSDTYMINPTEQYPFIDIDKYKDYYRYRNKEIVEVNNPTEIPTIEVIVDNIPVPKKEEAIIPKIDKPKESIDEIVDEDITPEIIVKEIPKTSNYEIKNINVFKSIFIPFVGTLILVVLLYVKREYNNIKL